MFDSVDDAISAAARTIVQRIPIGARAAVALSGGRTPKPMFEMMARAPLRDELAQRDVTWVVVDERYVPMGDPQSNAGAMQQIVQPHHRFLRFRTELGDPAATAAAFEDEWRSLGIEQLDVVMLGMGADGHTASLFPGTPVLDVEDRIASEVWVPRLEQWRVTITLPVIRAAKLRLVLATGESKAAILRDVQAGVPHPVALATTGGGETWWLVDRAAMGMSSRA